MSDNKQMFYARNLMSVCIDSTDGCDYQGRIWHQYSDEPLEFGGFLQMLSIMEGLLDEWDFPQKALSTRSFFRQDKSVYKRNVNPDELVIDQVQKENGVRNVQNQRGKRATFIVQVSFRQRATWQGHVIHAESDKKDDFASAMQLLRIMDGYLNS